MSDASSVNSSASDESIGNSRDPEHVDADPSTLPETDGTQDLSEEYGAIFEQDSGSEAPDEEVPAGEDELTEEQSDSDDAVAPDEEDSGDDGDETDDDLPARDDYLVVSSQPMAGAEASELAPQDAHIHRAPVGAVLLHQRTGKMIFVEHDYVSDAYSIAEERPDEFKLCELLDDQRLSTAVQACGIPSQVDQAQDPRFNTQGPNSATASAIQYSPLLAVGPLHSLTLHSAGRWKHVIRSDGVEFFQKHGTKQTQWHLPLGGRISKVIHAPADASGKAAVARQRLIELVQELATGLERAGCAASEQLSQASILHQGWFRKSKTDASSVTNSKRRFGALLRSGALEYYGDSPLSALEKYGVQSKPYGVLHLAATIEPIADLESKVAKRMRTEHSFALVTRERATALCFDTKHDRRAWHAAVAKAHRTLKERSRTSQPPGSKTVTGAPLSSRSGVLFSHGEGAISGSGSAKGAVSSRGGTGTGKGAVGMAGGSMLIEQANPMVRAAAAAAAAAGGAGSGTGKAKPVSGPSSGAATATSSGPGQDAAALSYPGGGLESPALRSLLRLESRVLSVFPRAHSHPMEPSLVTRGIKASVDGWSWTEARLEVLPGVGLLRVVEDDGAEVRDPLEDDPASDGNKESGGLEILLPLGGIQVCPCPEAPVQMRATSVQVVSPMARVEYQSAGGDTTGSRKELGRRGDSMTEVGAREQLEGTDEGPPAKSGMQMVRSFLGGILGAGTDPDEGPQGKSPGGHDTAGPAAGGYDQRSRARAAAQVRPRTAMLCTRTEPALLELLATIRLGAKLPEPDLERALQGTDHAPRPGEELCGWAHKTGSGLEDFKRRFVCLDPILGRATYYKGEDRSNCKGELMLDGAVATVGPPVGLRAALPTPFVITIAAPGRVTALCLDSMGEMLCWLATVWSV